MRKLIPPLMALGLALVCAVPAQAEKWLWFPIKGGAVAYDADSLKVDLATGETGADTVIFYDRPRSAGAVNYSFVAERLEFECRGSRHRWSQSAILDREGAILVSRPDSDWTPLGDEMGSAALFKRVLCMAETLPNGKEAPTLDLTLKAIRGAAPRMDLAAVAYPPAAPGPGAPIVTAPRAAAAPPSVQPPIAQASPAQAPARLPREVAAVKAPEPKVATIVTLPTPPPAAPGPVSSGLGYIPPPTSAVAGYQSAPRCVLFREDDTRTFRAVNSCSYPVNYAWCVTGGASPDAECRGPAFARGGGAISPRTEVRTGYIEGLGRTHLFACRAPALPRVRETAPGRFDYDCVGAPTATAQAAGSKASPKASAPMVPKLRR